MRNIQEVLRQKEADLTRVRGEVDALRLVTSLLTENEARGTLPEAKMGSESVSSTDKFAHGSSRRQA
jgi:hypothetical protein